MLAIWCFVIMRSVFHSDAWPHPLLFFFAYKWIWPPFCLDLALEKKCGTTPPQSIHVHTFSHTHRHLIILSLTHTRASVSGWRSLHYHAALRLCHTGVMCVCVWLVLFSSLKFCFAFWFIFVFVLVLRLDWKCSDQWNKYCENSLCDLCICVKEILPKMN